VGFTDRDFGDTRRPRRHRRFTLPDDPPTVPWVGRQRLAAKLTLEPDLVDRARKTLAHHLDRYCQVNGYVVDPETVSWGSWVMDEDGTTDIQLQVELVPRMDGVWGEIRQALAEDEADRQAATEAAETVHDGLDRLRAAAPWWRDGGPTGGPTAARAPSNAAWDPVAGDRPPSV